MVSITSLGLTLPPGQERLGVARPEGGWAFIDVRTVGVYVPSGQPGHRGHRLTQVIRDAKTTRRYDRLLARLLSRILGRTPTHVAAMPSRPGADDRLEELRWLMARALNARDTACLRQRFDVPPTDDWLPTDDPRTFRL